MDFDNLEIIVAYGVASHRDRESQQVSLFGGGAGVAISKPSLQTAQDWTTLERLEHEFSAIGFYLSSHPLGGYKLQLEQF